jgi:hypothetical protein
MLKNLKRLKNFWMLVLISLVLGVAKLCYYEKKKEWKDYSASI